MGNTEIMIMGDGIAFAGEIDAAARPGLRSGVLNRRAFLFGSAASLGALGLAGCATSDGMSMAEAARVYGPVPEEKFPIPAVDVSKIDPEISSPHRALRHEGSARHDHRRSRQLLRLPHRRRRNRHPLRRQCRPLRVPVERRRLCRAQGRMARLDAAQGDDPAPAGGGQICRRHAAQASTIRSAPARSISIRTAATRFTRSTAPATPRRSAPTSRAAAPASSARTCIDLYSRTPIKTKVVVLPA